MRQLPSFWGYTVDVRLREFRRAIPERVMEFVSFDTPKGQRILHAYLASCSVKKAMREEHQK